MRTSDEVRLGTPTTRQLALEQLRTGHGGAHEVDGPEVDAPDVVAGPEPTATSFAVLAAREALGVPVDEPADARRGWPRRAARAPSQTPQQPSADARVRAAAAAPTDPAEATPPRRTEHERAASYLLGERGHVVVPVAGRDVRGGL